MKVEKSKLEKLMFSIPISIAFVIVGLVVLGVTQVLHFSRAVIDIIIILGIIAFGMISCLLPAKILAKNKKSIFAWTVIGMTALVCLLWIIFIFIGQGVIDALAGDGSLDTALSGIWVYTQIVVFLTIQTFMVNLVCSNIYIFKKTMIPFQAVMYASNLIVDVWFTILIFAVKINAEGSFEFGANFLWDNKFVLTLFLLALAFTILSSAILKSIQKRRERVMTLEDHDKYAKSAEIQHKEEQKETIEERIKKLDDLKEKGIISEEEYKDKKAKILDEI